MAHAASFSWVWPGAGDASRGIWIGAPWAGHESLRLAVGDELAEGDLDVGLAEVVGDEPLQVVVGHPLEDDRVHLATSPDHRPPDGGDAGHALDVRVDRFGTLVEVGLLLLGEVVVEPVDDEDRDDQQGQRDDGQEGHRQSTLEGPWEEPAQTTGEAGAPLHGTISARRTRSRHLAPSGRTSAPPGRPRSCRADGSRAR